MLRPEPVPALPHGKNIAPGFAVSVADRAPFWQVQRPFFADRKDETAFCHESMLYNKRHRPDIDIPVKTQ